MFKVITMFAVVAVAAARPTFLGGTTSSLETIGSVVSNIPTAITHQSQTQIHSQPITISSPVINSIGIGSLALSNIQQSGSIISSPILSSQLDTSSLLQEQGQLLAGRGGLFGDQENLLNGQTIDLGDQSSLIGNEGLALGGQHELFENRDSLIGEQSSLINNSGSLNDYIGSSGLGLEGLH